MPRDPALLERDFPGNPNPVPKAPDIRASPAPAPAPASGDVNVDTPGGGPQLTAPTPADLTPKRLYTVTDLGKDGMGVSMYDEQHGTSDLGTVNIQDAHAVLNASGGSYNPAMKTWNVPEETATTLLSGRLSYPEYLIKRFEHGEAGAIESLNGQKFLLGAKDAKSTLEDSDLEMLKARVLENPAIAWNGGFGQLVGDILQHPAETFRQATGEGAEMLPNVIGALKASVVGGGIGALWGAAVSGGAAAGPAAGVGAARARLGYFIKTEAGSTAVELLRKKHNESTVRAIAPVVGIIKGTLDSVGFDLLTASTQRTILKGILGSSPVKAAMGKALEFGSGVAGDTVTQVLNTITSQLAEDTATDAESVGPNGKPRVFVPAHLRAQEIKDTILKTVMAAGTMKAADIAAGKLGERVKAAAKGSEKPKIEGAAPKAIEGPAPLPGEKPAGAQELTAPKEVPAPAEEAAPTPEMPTTTAGALEHGTPEQAADALEAVDHADAQDAGLVPVEEKAVGPLAQGDEDYRMTIERAIAKIKQVTKDTADKFAAPLKIGLLDYLSPESHLASKNPFFGALVLIKKAIAAKHGTILEELLKKHDEYAAAAQKSRGFDAADTLAPTMPEVFDFLNAETPEAGREAWSKLTSEEKRYAAFSRAFLDRAYRYLSTVEGFSSRFAPGEKGYFPWTEKRIGEILRDAPSKGWAQTLQAFKDRFARMDSDLSLRDSDGNIIDKTKFFKHALFRSGELDPSHNMARALKQYMNALSTKQAVDEMLPHFESAVNAQISLTKTSDPIVRKLNLGVQDFTVDFLNKLKGHSALARFGVEYGTMPDTLLRTLSSYVSWLKIAGRMGMQSTAALGSAAASSLAVGPHGLVSGEWRFAHERGRALVEKYARIAGKYSLPEGFKPGMDLQDKAAALAFGLISSGHTHFRQLAFLSLLTKGEFDSGEVSPARLAQVETTLGMSLANNSDKSILGSTSPGEAVTKLRSWAVPTLFTVVKDANAIRDMLFNLRDPNKRLTPAQWTRVQNFGLTAMAALAFTSFGLGGNSEQDKKDLSETGLMRRRLREKAWHQLQAIDPVTFVSAGPMLGWISEMATVVHMLAHQEQYKTGARRGQLKGLARFEDLNTPTIWKDWTNDHRRRR
jgi:hypothetical protein